MGPAEGSLIRKKFSFTESDDWQKHGKLSARTEFKLLKKHNGFSHIHCTLHTGRTHQIRATLLALAYPLVGDKIYGVDEQFFLSFIEGKLNEEDKKRLRIDRQALHCSYLCFQHPRTEEKLEFKCDIPEILNQFL